MTEDESRQQKASLLLELNEAEQELASLEEKAKGTSLRLKAFGEWLDDVVRAGTYGHYSVDGRAYISQLGSVNVLTDPQFAAAMNFDEACGTVKKIADARQRVSDLTERKRKLGLK